MEIRIMPWIFDILPIRPKAEDGESQCSWLTRIGELNRIKSKGSLRSLLFSNDSQPLRIQDFQRPDYGSFCRAMQVDETSVLATTFYYLAKNFGRSISPRSISSFLGGTLSDSLCYCPACLKENLYYRLVWRFSHINVCYRHSIQFMDHCGYCGKRIPLFTIPFKIGVCPYCNGSLWKLKGVGVNKGVENSEFHSKSIEFLLKNVDWESKGVVNFSELIGMYILKFQGNSPNPRGISSSYISQIRRGVIGQGVGLAEYIKYFEFFGKTLYDVIEADGLGKSCTINQNDSLDQSFNPENLKKGVVAKRVQYLEQVKIAIETLKNEGKLISTHSIAKHMEISPGTLYHYPEIMALLPRLDKKIIGKRNIASTKLLNEAQRAWCDILKNKIPTNREIARAIGISDVFYYPQVSEWLHNARKDYKRQKHINEINYLIGKLDHVKNIIVRDNLPTSIKTVAAILGCTARKIRKSNDLLSAVNSMLSKIPRKADHKRHNEDELLIELLFIRERLKQAGIKETQILIAREMNLTVSGLRQFPRIREIFDDIGRGYRERKKHEPG